MGTPTPQAGLLPGSAIDLPVEAARCLLDCLEIRMMFTASTIFQGLSGTKRSRRHFAERTLVACSIAFQG